MNTTSQVLETLRRALLQPTRGIVGLVDELLAAGREWGLQLEWQAETCRARMWEGGWKESMDLQLRKSVFRAILARVAALCNERNPHSVSPYGGQGELLVGENGTAAFKVVFVNTPATQTLELLPLPHIAAGARQPREVTEG